MRQPKRATTAAMVSALFADETQKKFSIEDIVRSMTYGRIVIKN